jgi:hypothetical protein
VTPIDALSAALPVAGDVLGWDEVAAAWSGQSALPGYTVGGLAAHLGMTVARGVQVLEEPEPDHPVVPLGAWFGANRPDHTAEALHDWLRQQAEDQAAAGPGEIRARFAVSSKQLARLAVAVRPDRRVAVVSIANASATAGDYLASRLVEVAVHLDDLATSVGREAPLPDGVWQTTAAVLTDVACGREGPLAVVRALARVERARPGVLPAL